MVMLCIIPSASCQMRFLVQFSKSMNLITKEIIAWYLKNASTDCDLQLMFCLTSRNLEISNHLQFNKCGLLSGSSKKLCKPRDALSFSRCNSISETLRFPVSHPQYVSYQIQGRERPQLVPRTPASVNIPT